MYQLIYPALFGVLVLFYPVPTAASEKEQTQVQLLGSVVIQSNTTDWKQANQKVAELGGWQFYASEAGAHPVMDHSHHQHMDHSKHSEPVDHSKHKNHRQMDHSKHSAPQQIKTGDEHEHHH